MQSETEKALMEILGEGFDGLNENLRAGMLGCRPETIGKSHEKLIELGLKPEKIASRADLLGRDPDTIRRNAKALQDLGLAKEKIASQAQLLGMNPETIRRNAEALQNLGLTKEKIASRADLLGRDPDTIRRNYQFLRRFFSRETILQNPALLGNSGQTVRSSVMMLDEYGISH
ncbi:hypothetical protein GF318_03175, partial [Candidatus Micrarchaeota archaeon]|nr:hypothetical protein [Candidatus Micrarchaeota archaeon]